jgi:3-keto-5-aminohexanoate cleavage enzyme
MARVDEPVIIEAAINGGATKAANPHVPISPDEHVADILAVLEAGAAIVHHHDALAPTDRAARLAEVAGGVFRRVLDERPDALCYPATVWGGPIEERLAHHRLLAQAGLLRVAFLDPGSTNLGVADEEGLPAPTDFIYAHSPREVRWWFDDLTELELGPMFSIFEPSFLRVPLAYERAGRLPRGSFVKLYFSGGGRADGRAWAFGMPPLPACLDAYLAMLDGSNAPWAVAVLGGDVIETGLARLALERGGHLRVGLEDYVGRDQPTNAEVVARAVELCAEVGRPVATPDEAAQLLDIPRTRSMVSAVA